MQNNTRYLVELHGKKYIIYNNIWTDVTKEIDFSLIEVDYIVSDYSSFPSFTHVRSPKKFAEIILEKKLLENGEIIGDSKIIVHKKNEISPQNTDIFYTAVPLSNFTQYAKRINDVKQVQLSFCFHQLLVLALAQNAKTEAVCVIIFVYHDSVEILAGNKKSIIGFEVLESYLTEGAINSSDDVDIAHIKKRLEFIQRSSNVRINQIYGYSWLKAGRTDSWVNELGREMDIPSFEGSSTEINLNNTFYYSSIVPLFEQLHVDDSISENPIKLSYKLYHKIPLLTVALLLINIGASIYYFSLEGDLQKVSSQLHTLKQENKQFNPETIQKIDYQSSLKLAMELESSKAKPSYAQLLSELINAIGSENLITFDLLKLNYVGKEELDKNTPIKIELKGIVHQGFSNGVNSINSFVANLNSQGYKLLDSKIIPKVEMTHFHIVMER